MRPMLRHGVKAGQSQSGDTHRHEALRHIHRNPEHFKEAGHTVAEHLERRPGSCRAVLRSGSTRHAQRNHGQQAFQHHGAVAHLEHILFIGNCFGGSAAGNKAVETGNSTAGNRDKQDREQVAELIVVETGVNRQVHGRMRHHEANDGRKDHAHKHEGGHVVAGLL